MMFDEIPKPFSLLVYDFALGVRDFVTEPNQKSFISLYYKGNDEMFAMFKDAYFSILMYMR